MSDCNGIAVPTHESFCNCDYSPPSVDVHWEAAVAVDMTPSGSCCTMQRSPGCTMRSPLDAVQRGNLLGRGLMEEQTGHWPRSEEPEEGESDSDLGGWMRGGSVVPVAAAAVVVGTAAGAVLEGEGDIADWGASRSKGPVLAVEGDA